MHRPHYCNKSENDSLGFQKKHFFTFNFMFRSDILVQISLKMSPFIENRKIAKTWIICQKGLKDHFRYVAILRMYLLVKFCF